MRFLFITQRNETPFNTRMAVDVGVGDVFIHRRSAES